MMPLMVGVGLNIVSSMVRDRDRFRVEIGIGIWFVAGDCSAVSIESSSVHSTSLAILFASYCFTSPLIVTSHFS